MDTWLGLDVGTSSVKAILVDETGRVVARGSADYGSRGSGRHHEQDARDYLDAARRALQDCAGDLSPDTIAGIGVVGHTPSLVLVDAGGAPVHPVLTWRDARADTEAAALAEEFGPSEDLLGVANLWAPSHLPAKLLRVARAAPDAVAAAAWVLTPKDYVGFQLTGVAGTDPWSMKGLWSIRDDRRADEVLARAGVRPGLVPAARAPWSRLGTTTPAAAESLGLREGVPVAIGWSDALSGMLGIGAATRPISFILTGTSDIVGTSSPGAGPAPDGLYAVPEPLAPVGIHYGPTQSSGASLLWLARVVGASPGDLVRAAATAADTRATFLPYLTGERAPLWDADLRAGLLGLSESDGRDELALAVLRGVAHSGRHVLERSWGEGARPDAVHLGGSSVRQEGWIRARSEVLAQDLVLHEETQLTALGAAMLGRSAATEESISRSQAALAGPVHRVPADPAGVERAQRLHAAYLSAVTAARERRVADDLARL